MTQPDTSVDLNLVDRQQAPPAAFREVVEAGYIVIPHIDFWNLCNYLASGNNPQDQVIAQRLSSEWTKRLSIIKPELFTEGDSNADDSGK